MMDGNRDVATPKATRSRRWRQGVAAIEMAMAAPILSMLFLGVVEVSHYISVVGRINWAANVLADQISRLSTVDKSALTSFGVAAQQIVYPYPATSAVLAVGATSYVLSGTYTQNGKCDQSTASIDSSWKQVQTLLGTANNLEIPDSSGLKSTVCPLIDNGGSVIYVSVAYNYTPLTNLPAFNVVIKNHIFMRPRLTAQISCTDCS